MFSTMIVDIVLVFHLNLFFAGFIIIVSKVLLVDANLRHSSKHWL